MKKLNIQINLDNMEEIYHPYNKETLHPTLANFIEEECKGKNKKTKIQISFHTKTPLAKEEQNEIANLIHKHFKEETQEEMMKMKWAFSFYFMTLLVGFLFILISIYTKDSFFKEFFTIIAWVAIWEAVSSFTFTNFKENIRYNRMKELSHSSVSFFKE